MKAPNVQNSRYEGLVGNKVGLICTLDGARYHVWLDAKTFELVEENHLAHPFRYALHRRPPRGVFARDPGYFSEQFLSATSKRGAAIVAAMRKQADANGGITKLLRAGQARRIAESAQAKRDCKERAIREAAPELYEALADLLRASAAQASIIQNGSVRMDVETRACIARDKARVLLAKVDAS